MVFKKLLSAVGVGGPSVDTVLSNPDTRPGLTLEGQVNLVGGTQQVTIQHVTVSLVTRVEIESGDSEYDGLVEFQRVPVSDGLQLREGEELSLPMQLPVPWETPVTDVYGQHLHGMTMGLRTEVAIAGAIDKSDLDPVSVHPLPVQERILAAFADLGFRFKHADLEAGRIHGVPQSLPFYQEIEFFPGPEYARGVNEMELTFVTDPQQVEVVLEFDKRSGLFTPGADSVARYRVAHADADTTDWRARVDAWVREALDRHQDLLSRFGKPHGHGSGVGSAIGGMVGGAALGFAAGMVADEVFDAFTDDD